MTGESKTEFGLERTLRALLLVSLDPMKQREQITILDKAGFRQSEIAEVVGSTSKAVSVRLAEIRKEIRNSSGRRSKWGGKLSDQDSTYEKWIPVIARSLAYLCVQVGELKEKSLADKASFLEAAGVERKDVAAMLGTTYGSVSETLSKAKREKKGEKKKNGKRKAR
jgi:predicted transcriptional regulator